MQRRFFEIDELFAIIGAKNARLKLTTAEPRYAQGEYQDLWSRVH